MPLMCGLRIMFFQVLTKFDYRCEENEQLLPTRFLHDDRTEEKSEKSMFTRLPLEYCVIQPILSLENEAPKEII